MVTIASPMKPPRTISRALLLPAFRGCAAAFTFTVMSQALGRYISRLMPLSSSSSAGHRFGPSSKLHHFVLR